MDGVWNFGQNKLLTYVLTLCTAFVKVLGHQGETWPTKVLKPEWNFKCMICPLKDAFTYTVTTKGSTMIMYVINFLKPFTITLRFSPYWHLGHKYRSRVICPTCFIRRGTQSTNSKEHCMSIKEKQSFFCNLSHFYTPFRYLWSGVWYHCLSAWSAAESNLLPPSIDLISKLLKGEEGWISQKFGSLFVHGDFSAFAGWILIPFSQ